VYIQKFVYIAQYLEVATIYHLLLIAAEFAFFHRLFGSKVW